MLEDFNDKFPFTLYKSGTPIGLLVAYMGERIRKADMLSARKAFRELKYFAAQCSERIIADLSCQVILRYILGMEKGDSLLFFVERSASDKMLGRLASLQIDLSSVTICFMSYSPADLMTIAITNQTGKLHFDLNRLMTTASAEFYGPYPGESEDSLTQTYFHRPSSVGGDEWEFSPIRFDIFAQGLQRDDLERKKDLLEKVFLPHSGETLPEQLEHFPRKLYPSGYEILKERLEAMNDEIQIKILRD